MAFRALLFALRKHSWLLLRYGVAGAFGAFVQTFTLYLWVTVFGLQETYLFGALLGFCLALAITFLLQKHWTFRDHTKYRTERQLMWYAGVAVINAFINIALLALTKHLVSTLGIDFFAGWYLLAQLTIVGFASGVSFLLNYNLTFRHEMSAVEESLESPPL
jgi:putative flippase GtrA